MICKPTGNSTHRGSSSSPRSASRGRPNKPLVCDDDDDDDDHDVKGHGSYGAVMVPTGTDKHGALSNDMCDVKDIQSTYVSKVS